MRVFKWCGIGLLVVALLLASLLAFALFGVDPNWLKPELERRLAQQGVYVALESDIGWQFFPQFGLSLEDVSLHGTPAMQDDLLAKLQALQFTVAIKPLFDKRIEVIALRVNGATVQYYIAQDGTSNWDSLLKREAAGASDVSDESTDAKASPVTIEIDELALAAVTLDYRDASTATQLRISDLALEVQQLNLQGDLAQVHIAAAIDYNAVRDLDLELNTGFSFDEKSQRLALPQGAVTVTNKQGASIKTSFDAQLNLQDKIYQAEVALNVEALRQWLTLFDVALPPDLQPTALRKASVAGAIRFGDDRLEANQLLISVDDTVLEGEAQVVLEAGKSLPKITTHWRSELVNIDSFLIPPASSDPEEESPQPDADTQLPLELLRDLDVDASLAVGKLIYQTIELVGVNVQLEAHNGLLKVPQLQASLRQGVVSGKGELDARGETAQVTIALDSKRLDVGYLLATFADFKQLEGLLNGKVQVSTSGNATSSLQKNLQASASLDSSLLTFSPVNIVKSFCKAVAFVEGKELAQKDWEKYTTFSPVSMKAQLSGPVVKLESLDASVEKFQAQAQGMFDIAQGKFDFPFQLKLADFAAELEGCNFVSEQWRKKSMPLRCKGSLDKLGIDTCQPDYDSIKEKFKEKITQKLDQEKERAKERAEEKIEGKLRKELERKLPADELNNLKDIIKKKSQDS